MKFSSSQVAVITGGASGIGLALAQAVVERGGRVAIVDIRRAAVEDAAQKLREGGGDAVGFTADVGDYESVADMASEVMDEFGRVDLLCNNAGLVSPSAPAWEQTAETWKRLIDVKLFGVINGIRAFVPHLVAQGSGHVLNTASSGGLAPLVDRSPYAATMHAVVGLTETLDLELRRASPLLGATVLCPGLVDTPLGQNSMELGAVTLPPAALEPGALRRMARGAPVLDARDVAEQALRAIESDRVHSAPGDDVWDRAEARVEHLLEDLRVERDS